MGGGLPLSSLKPHYDAVLFSYGASKDRELGLPNERSLSGIFSARAFVGWYNGLPDYRNLSPDLASGEDAVIIGQGNVALDVARVLLSDVDVLRKTDMSEHALEELAKSRVKRVRVVGRRGPMQVSLVLSCFYPAEWLTCGYRPLSLLKKFGSLCSYLQLDLNLYPVTYFLPTR